MLIQNIKTAIRNHGPAVRYCLVVFTSLMLINHIFNIDAWAYEFGQKINKMFKS
jgi:hypothetical protein